jgi:hypothetical protein
MVPNYIVHLKKVAKQSSEKPKPGDSSQQTDKAKKLNSVIFTREKSGHLNAKPELLQWRQEV